MALRIGVIGCGFGATVHVPAFQTDPRVRVIALAASTLAKASSTARIFDVPLFFDNWQALVDSPEVDAVVVAVPPFLQPAVVMRAFERGKPVLAEKPLASKLSDAQALIRRAFFLDIPALSIPAMVNFNFVELLAFKKAQELLRDNVIGRIRHVAVHWHVESRVNINQSNHWKASTELGGGTLFNFVSHSLFYLEWFLGSITGLQAHLTTMPEDSRTGDTFVSLSYDFQNDAVGSLSVSASSYCGSGHRIEFYGDYGALILENTTSDYMRGFSLRCAKRPASYNFIDLPEPLDSNQDSRIAPTASLGKRFVDWILTDIPSRPNFEDALRVQTLLDYCRRSSDEGRFLQVPLPQVAMSHV